MSATKEFIDILSCLKPGELGLLRMNAGQGLDESVEGFDLFAGIWWPLRQKTPNAPRREVAWLIAKLYSACRAEPSQGDMIARQLSRCQPREPEARRRFRMKFDELLMQPLNNIEPDLRWAIHCISSRDMKLDWVKLTDDLSIWERENTRRTWAEQFIENGERSLSC